ncbi:MAG: tetratricopeptide repeat protein [Longimicrobiales bacterium]
MPPRFLSSEEYDQQAHQLYNDGDYDAALELLKEALSYYPESVDLYVGMGYARLAREEFAWSRRSFEHALLLDSRHEDALVGLGETLLRLGEHKRALRLFDQVTKSGFSDDVDLLLTMGRALYREGMYASARDLFAKAAAGRPDSAEAAASLGYSLHRLGDEVAAGRQIRRALRLNPDLHEARIYLGHILYDRGDWDGTLREFDRVSPKDHWDSLAVWRTLELRQVFDGLDETDPRLEPWRARLDELEGAMDPVDRVLAEIEAKVNGWQESPDPSQLDLFPEGGDQDPKCTIRRGDGRTFHGSPTEIVRQMRDAAGFSQESLSRYMRRLSERWLEQFGLEIPSQDPRSFLNGAVHSGLLRLDGER